MQSMSTEVPMSWVRGQATRQWADTRGVTTSVMEEALVILERGINVDSTTQVKLSKAIDCLRAYIEGP